MRSPRGIQCRRQPWRHQPLQDPSQRRPLLGNVLPHADTREFCKTQLRGLLLSKRLYWLAARETEFLEEQELPIPQEFPAGEDGGLYRFPMQLDRWGFLP